MPANIESSTRSVGDMLRRSVTYKIPRFQRDYSWTDDEYGRFWYDLLDTILADQTPEYFLGSMVIKTANPPLLEVVDGQQRLTTICLLLCALRDLLKAADEGDNAGRLANDFLGRYDYSTRVTQSRIELNKNDKQFYQDKILSPLGGFSLENVEELRTISSRRRKTLRSNKLLASAYLYFFDEMTKQIKKEKECGRRIDDFVQKIVTAIDKHMYIIEISVKDNYDAYLLFETLNDRGLELSTADLLKNYIFSKSNDDVLGYVQDDWDTMAAFLNQTPIRTFIRHYWLSKKGVVRDKELYRVATREYEDSNSVRGFTRELKDAAEYYGAFRSTESDVWNFLFEKDDRIIIHTAIKDMKFYGRVTQIYPLLLAVIETNPSIFARIYRMVNVFTFRFSVIGRARTGNLEKVFSDAARYVRQNQRCTASEVFARVKGLYPSDDDFIREFSKKEFMDKDKLLARHILKKINDHLSSSDVVAREGLTLEHILPKSISSEWLTVFERDEAEQYLYRLGNMTLLTGKLNKKIQNSSFLEKKEQAYRLGDLAINRSLLDLPTWNAEAIERRQQEMAKHACHIWRLPYQ